MPKISNIYQDKKSGKWYFVANLGYDEHGKRVRHWERGFSTQKEAKTAYDEYMNNYSKTSVKKNSSMSFKEFYETYFEPDYKQKVKPRTFDNRSAAMRMHFAYFFNRKLKDINAPMIKKWQNKLSENYSSYYAHCIFSLFEKSLDLAIKLGLLQINVAKKVGNVKKEKKRVEFWTQEEFEKVIATFDTSNYYDNFALTIIWLLFMTGIRRGEAQALEWEKDIDFTEKTLSISKSMYYKSAKEFYVTEPKTATSNRVIALDDNTIELLRQWKKIQDKNMPSKYILSYNGLPFSKGAPGQIINRHSKLANVHHIKVHALRHSHAALLISLGENALIIRDRLGHEDIQTTLGTYGHLYPNTNKEVARKLTNLIKISEQPSIERKFSSNQHVRNHE